MQNYQDDKNIQNVAIAFLNGTGLDNRGRNVIDYQNMTEDQVEGCHDWVQWAFPIDTVSKYNPNSGRLFAYLEPWRYFHGKTVQNRDKIMDMYLDYLGFIPDPIGLGVNLTRFFSIIDNEWNHNILRLSRLMKHLSLTETGSTRHYREDLYACLIRDIARIDPHRFNQKTLIYWAAINGKFDTGQHWF